MDVKETVIVGNRYRGVFAGERIIFPKVIPGHGLDNFFYWNGMGLILDKYTEIENRVNVRTPPLPLQSPYSEYDLKRGIVHWRPNGPHYEGYKPYLRVGKFRELCDLALSRILERKEILRKDLPEVTIPVSDLPLGELVQRGIAIGWRQEGRHNHFLVATSTYNI